MSEATNHSPSPRPTTTGGPLRTATIFSVIVRGQQHDREQAAQPLHRPQHGVLEAVVLPLLLDQVRDDLGVGLGDELVALALQLLLQLEVVLDDAVVNDDDPAGAVAMRVRVLFGGAAVRGPARVAEAVDAAERLVRDHLLEVRELAGAAANVDAVAVDDRHAGRVVAAILEPPQALDEDGDDGLVADVADDAAHSQFVSSSSGSSSECALRLCGFRTLNFELGTSSVLLRSRPSPPCSPAGRGAMPSAPAGTSSVIVDPAAMYALSPDRDRRDQRRVAADERAVLDDRLVLVLRRRSCT